MWANYLPLSRATSLEAKEHLSTVYSRQKLVRFSPFNPSILLWSASVFPLWSASYLSCLHLIAVSCELLWGRNTKQGSRKRDRSSKRLRKSSGFKAYGLRSQGFECDWSGLGSQNGNRLGTSSIDDIHLGSKIEAQRCVHARLEWLGFEKAILSEVSLPLSLTTRRH